MMGFFATCRRCSRCLFPGRLSQNLTFPDLYLLNRWHLLPLEISKSFSQPGKRHLLPRQQVAKTTSVHPVHSYVCMLVFQYSGVGEKKSNINLIFFKLQNNWQCLQNSFLTREIIYYSQFVIRQFYFICCKCTQETLQCL